MSVLYHCAGILACYLQNCFILTLDGSLSRNELFWIAVLMHNPVALEHKLVWSKTRI